MDNHIFHLGIVDAGLRLAAPGFLGGGEAVVDADELDMVEVEELEPARVLDPSSKDQVKLAHRRLASRNCFAASALFAGCVERRLPGGAGGVGHALEQRADRFL